MKLKRFLYYGQFFILLIINNLLLSQQSMTNTSTDVGSINISTPRTPEATAFEKYGTFSVNEFAGTPNISIPIYTLTSRNLSVPINLSYTPTGIRVSQEASWVGLGFDLNVGGRVTVETRGSIDFCSATAGYSSATTLRTGMTKIFNRLGNNSDLAMLTYAAYCSVNCQPADSVADNLQALQEMSQFGTGEPDIFRANFFGNSLAFYFDKTTTGLDMKWIGERSLFSVTKTQDSLGNITGWTIKDNDARIYYFTQIETTTNTNPGTIVPATTTSAWLLTRIEYPTGDYIQFTYSNYGYSIPAFLMGGSAIHQFLATGATVGTTVSSDYDQNVNLQSPYYLTSMESKDAKVDFILASRTDLYGPGSRKLSEIQVKEKGTNRIIKKAIFNYSYFQGSILTNSRSYLASLYYNLPSPLSQTDYLATSNYRLRLDSLMIAGGGIAQNPYKFSYDTSFIPDKYSLSQDHWGNYNNVNNNAFGYGFTHLIPYGGSFGIQTALTNMGNPVSSSILAASRDCDSAWMQVMSLKRITYPTGGISEFIYEPHYSKMITSATNITGGGLRIKTINNYSLGRFAGRTDYSYHEGKYMGTIQYLLAVNNLGPCQPDGLWAQAKLISNGAVNSNDILIGYSQITITQKDSLGTANGSTIKKFYIDNASSTYANGSGFNIQEAHYPLPTGPYSTAYLNAAYSGLAPTPSLKYEGKLIEEKYLDNNNKLLKSVNYYYRLGDSSNNFYSIKAIMNRTNAWNTSCGFSHENWGTDNGVRPVIIFVSPAKSFSTITDSIVTKTYQDSSHYIADKQTFKYNKYYQPEYVSKENSDGSQSITHTATMISFADQMIAVGAYSQYGSIISTHAYNLPVEQTSLVKNLSGDSLVTGSTYVIYDGTEISKVNRIEPLTPLAWRSQFAPIYYNISGFQLYSQYKLYDSVQFTTGKLIKDYVSKTNKKSFIWDTLSSTLLAQCIDANSDHIAYSSFETTSKGNWSYSGTASTDNTTITGSKYYNLSGGSVTKSGLNSSGKYTVSYWSKNGQQTVSNSSSVTTGRSVGSWVYYQHLITNPTSGNLSVSGSGAIDELRLYPQGSQMTTFTYYPLIGTSSQCDVNNRISYYEYDSLNRLIVIKDQERNILKRICYNYAGQQETCMQGYKSVAKNGNFTRNNCGSGYTGSTVTYTVPADSYYGYTQGEADSLAQADVDANGQAYANANGTCTCNPLTCAAPSQQCIFNSCYTGELKCVSAVFNKGTWTCTYRYIFSIDCSSIFSHTTTGSSACTVAPPCH